MAKPEMPMLSELESRAATFFDRPGFSMPAWIDDTRLAILDDRSGVPQLSIMNAETGHVRQVTSFGERLLSLVVASNGTIVFGMDTGGDERQQLWRFDPVTESPVRITHQPKARFEPGAISADGRYVMATTNARDEGIFDIVRVDVFEGEFEPWLLESGTASALALSQNGNLAIVKRLNTNLDGDLVAIDHANGTTINLTPHEGEAWIFNAALAANETELWFLTNEGREFVRLEAMTLATGERRVIAEAEWDIEAFALSPDGNRLAYAINRDGWNDIILQNTTNDAPPVPLEGLPRGTIDRMVWSPDSQNLAFGFSTATESSSIVLVSSTGDWELMAGENDNPKPPAVEPELVKFQSFDGTTIQGFLFIPPGDGPIPVLVEVHGGPESQRRLQYSSAVPTDQFIQSLGIAVLSLNVRGSTGYGKTYSHLDDKEKRLDAVQDVMAAVEWLRQRDDVDSDRIAIMGQSYGGFMTLASIAFHPGNWAAAVDVVGIASFVTFLERTGPWRRKHRSEEYGFLETDREMLERISPLNKVDQIDTPLMVIHGRNDPRVPLHEAEQIHAALEARGQEVVLRVFDNEGHGLSKRQNRIAGYAESGAFLMKHLLT